MRLNNRGNLSLIGLLAVVVIIGVAFYFYLGKGGGPASVKSDSELVDQSSGKQTVFGKSMDKAKGVDCQERLRQIRVAVENYKMTSESGGPPPTFKDMGMSVGPDYFTCPVSKQAYLYDSATGGVRCPYPSHAKF